MRDQRDVRLESTHVCVENLILARELGHSTELCAALFQLLEKTACMEWGAGTTVDDFSDPENIIVTNGVRTKKICTTKQTPSV